MIDSRTALGQILYLSTPTHDPNSSTVVAIGNDRVVTLYHEVRIERPTWISPSMEELRVPWEGVRMTYCCA